MNNNQKRHEITVVIRELKELITKIDELKADEANKRQSIKRRSENLAYTLDELAKARANLTPDNNCLSFLERGVAEEMGRISIIKAGRAKTLNSIKRRQTILDNHFKHLFNLCGERGFLFDPKTKKFKIGLCKRLYLLYIGIFRSKIYVEYYLSGDYSISAIVDILDTEKYYVFKK